MAAFRQISDGIDVHPLLAQIRAHPSIWNERTNRTGFAGSPFSGTSDAWLRYRNPTELNETKDFKAPHWSANYPAWHLLPAAQAVVFGLMAVTRAVHLGGVLLTKIPPGGKILPHHDRGSWHAEQMNLKVYVPVMSNDQCINFCGDETRVIRAGEAVSFDNQIVHSVENRGETDRVTLICCYRVDE